MAAASRRERRLWTGAALALAAIYGSIPFAGALAEILRASRLLVPAFGVGFALAIGLTIAHALRGARTVRALWVASAVATVWLMLVVRLGVSPAERGHLFEYGLLSLLIHEALTERWRDGAGAFRTAVTAVAATAALGWIDEGLQTLVPDRVYDLRDVGVNALAAAVAVASSLALGWAAARRGERRAAPPDEPV